MGPGVRARVHHPLLGRSDDVVVGRGRWTGGVGEVVIPSRRPPWGAGVGAHLAAVEVSDDSGRIGVARTFLVSAPPQVTPTPLTLLPLPARRGRDATASGLDAAVQERLGPLVDGSADAARGLGRRPRPHRDRRLRARVGGAAAGTPTAGATPDPTASSSASPRPSRPSGSRSGWGASRPRARARRDVLGLPFGDPDLEALSRAPRGPSCCSGPPRPPPERSTGSPARRCAPTSPGRPTRPPTRRLLGFCVEGRASTVVLDDRCLVPDPDLTFTPSAAPPSSSPARARSPRSSPTGRCPRSWPTPPTPTRPSSCGSGSSPRPPRRRCSGPTIPAVSCSSPPQLRPGRGHARHGSSRPGVVGVGGVADAHRAVPGDRAGRRALRAPGRRRTNRAALPTGHVEDVERQLVAVDDFRSALQTSTPDADLLSQQRAALALLGASWRGHTDELPAARAALGRAVQLLTAGVSIATGSVRNLAAERSELPITVVNELDVPVLVDLVLRPRTPRVQLDAVPRQTVPARSQQRVAVPVRALARERLRRRRRAAAHPRRQRDRAGRRHPPQRARRRGELDLGVVGGGAAGLLVLGVVRAFRKGRRRVDQAEHPVDPPPRTPGEEAREASAPSEPGSRRSSGPTRSSSSRTRMSRHRTAKTTSTRVPPTRTTARFRGRESTGPRGGRRRTPSRSGDEAMIRTRTASAG